MSKSEEKKLAEFYLRTAKTMQEASIKMGLRSALGYIFTSEERNALSEIQEIFFPAQEFPEDMPHEVLNKASSVLIDAWAGVPVAYLPSVSRLRTAEHTAKMLRSLPVHFGERRNA